MEGLCHQTAQGVQISDLAAGHTWEFNMESLFSSIKWASLFLSRIIGVTDSRGWPTSPRACARHHGKYFQTARSREGKWPTTAVAVREEVRLSLFLPFVSTSQTCAVVWLRKPGRRWCRNHESLWLRHFSGAVAVMTTCSRCSVINPAAATACDALSGCDIFQRQSRDELASLLMANQGCGRGHTLAQC